MIFAYITVFPRTRSGFFVYASMEGPAHSYPCSETQALSSRYAFRYSLGWPLNDNAATFIAGISRIRTPPSGGASPEIGIPISDRHFSGGVSPGES